MKIYTITYDLIKEKNYKLLIEAIKKLSNKGITYNSPTRSQWLIQSKYDAQQINTYLMKCIDHDDMLLVMEVNIDNLAGYNLSKDTVKWLGL